jgi:hypothetical protein
MLTHGEERRALLSFSQGAFLFLHDPGMERDPSLAFRGKRSLVKLTIAELCKKMKRTLFLKHSDKN